MSDEGEWAHSPDDTDRIASLEAEVKRLCTDAERERLARRAVDQALREAMAEVERLRPALRSFRALADAIDTMGGLTDEEWVRLKPRVMAYATNARTALDTTVKEDQ